MRTQSDAENGTNQAMEWLGEKTNKKKNKTNSLEVKQY
jgi:hypothetical protein